jgi:hypothetical protein
VCRKPREAQFLVGLTLIQTNLAKFVGRVPILSRVPVVGRRFEDISYSIDSGISQEQLAEAYRWIQKSADKGFAPATTATNLFTKRISTPASAGAGNRLPLERDADGNRQD